MAVLVRTQGSQGKWVYPLGHRAVLGRHADCDIADLFTENPSASRFHAVVELVGGRYAVEDRGSRNGTYLNGQRVNGQALLRSGDRLLIAGVELIFLEEADVVGPAGTVPPADVGPVTFVEPGSATLLASLAVAAPAASISLGDHSAEKLRALVQMLTRLGRSLEIDSMLHELLAGLFAIFSQARRGFVAFTAEGQDDVILRATHFSGQESDPRVAIGRTVVRHVLSKREAVLWADWTTGPITSGSLMDLGIRALMCAPLLDGEGRPFGVVQLDTDDSLRAFATDDLEVIVGAVSQAAVAVRFAMLHEIALRRHAIERDLDLARRVQLGLLPEGCPDYEGFEFFAYYRAAYEVGGDYYDFVELPNERLAVVVADVAGKGVSAALLMAKLSGELKHHLSCEPPGNALARMNNSLCAGRTGRFVTLLVAILDRRSSTMTLVNAGHLAPLCRKRDGSVEAVAEAHRGPAIGLIPEQQYQEVTIAIEPGDLWLAYTDGVTEATSSSGELFGGVRLRERLTAMSGAVHESGDRVVREVLTFLGDQPLSDDICVVSWGLTNIIDRVGTRCTGDTSA